MPAQDEGIALRTLADHTFCLSHVQVPLVVKFDPTSSSLN